MASDKKEIVAILNKPLTSHNRRGSGGLSYAYYKGVDVIRRLNEAFDHCWSSEKLETTVIDDQILMLVSLSAWIDGEVITHHGYGSCKIKRKGPDAPAIDIGNNYKSAFTTALKKAAEQFGIGLGPDEEEADSDFEAPSRQVKPAPSAAAPPNKLKAPATMKSFNKPTNMMKAPTPLSNAPVSLPKASTAVKKTTAVDEDHEPLSSINLTVLRNLSELNKISETELIKAALPGSNKTKFEELLRFEAINVAKYAHTL